MDKEYLTQEKYDELKIEFETLKTVRRKEVAEHLEFAKSLGDLSENAEYHAALEEQGEIEDRIHQLDDVLKRAEIIKTHHSTKVEIGSTLVVKKNGQDATAAYTVVGTEEADLATGRISYTSPLGLALMGKKKGDKVTVLTPRGEARYQIVDIK